MRRWIEIYREFVRLGDALRSDLPGEIRTAEERNWDAALVERIKAEFGRYAAVVSKLALRLAALACAPLLLSVLFLAQHAPKTGFVTGWYYFSLLCFWGLGLGAIRLIFPVLFLARVLKKLPASHYQEMVWSAILSLDVLNLLLNAGLLFYLYANMDGTASLPVLVVVVLWLFAPWLAYTMGRDDVFIKVRVGQLAALLVLSLLVAASPVPVKNLQWWATREAANKLRPTEQQEITASWETLQWFTPEGRPNVWYSFSTERGYRLFGSPGFDTATGQELKPVADMATKEQIVAALGEQKAAQQRKDALAAQQRQAALDAQKQQAALAEQQRQAALTEQRAAQAAAALQQTVRAYVRNPAAPSVPIALLVVDAGRAADVTVADRIGKVLTGTGIAADSAVFTPAFVASPVFGDVLAGRAPVGGFHPETYAARLLVVEVSSSVAPQQPVQGVAMLAADVTWKVRLLAAADGRVERSFEVNARGAGFNESAARTNAMERAEADLAKLAPSLRQ